jgi:hypothetical protein
LIGLRRVREHGEKHSSEQSARKSEIAPVGSRAGLFTADANGMMTVSKLMRTPSHHQRSRKRGPKPDRRRALEVGFEAPISGWVDKF